MRKLPVRHLIQVALFAALMALAAQVSFQVGPVPITAQSFAVLLTGLLLGSRLGALAVLVYLALGAVGAPVFAGASGGAARLIGPSGGFLIGFAAAAYLAGLIAERRRRLTAPAALVACLLASIATSAFGVAWLAIMSGKGLGYALQYGLYPFLIGDALKIAAATAIAVPVRNRLSELGLLPAPWRH